MATLLLQTLVFRISSSSSSSSSLLKPLSITSLHIPKFSTSKFSAQNRLFCNSSPSPSYSLTYAQDEGSIGEERGSDEGVVENEERASSTGSVTVAGTGDYKSAVKLSLSVKEKKELASYAHSLGKKLKSQQVGKSGVTASVAASFVENLESNELLKLKVHNNCPGEFVDVVKQLENATGSVAVFQIGRSVILYRPSLSKLEAKRKKEQNQRVVKKGFRVKSAEPLQRREQVSRVSGRGRRGSSRRAAPVLVSDPST
ncbi:hypothetical protein Syun_005185 [Stephania yunnanensis]|uniref:CRM domain-containing protein n=1 Tax=Stephania yunnanensis TaxID=152371 RepID=A0AAP0L5S8_9MAGN